MHFSTTGLVGNVPDWTVTHLDTTKLTDWSHIDQEVVKLSKNRTKYQSNYLSRASSKSVSGNYSVGRVSEELTVESIRDEIIWSPYLVLG